VTTISAKEFLKLARCKVGKDERRGS
jgi:hypothetical protein